MTRYGWTVQRGFYEDPRGSWVYVVGFGGPIVFYAPPAPAFRA